MTDVVYTLYKIYQSTGAHSLPVSFVLANLIMDTGLQCILLIQKLRIYLNLIVCSTPRTEFLQLDIFNLEYMHVVLTVV